MTMVDTDKPVMPTMVGKFKFYVPLDNHNTPRSDAVWDAEVWERPDGDRTVRILGAADVFKDAYRAFYLIDDGESVVPHYVAGFNPTTYPGAVFLHPFPTNPGGRTMRADRPEPVDYSNWVLGPRRAYHLKIVKEG
jgi:hypothetical protein